MPCEVGTRNACTPKIGLRISRSGVRISPGAPFLLGYSKTQFLPLVLPKAHLAEYALPADLDAGKSFPSSRGKLHSSFRFERGNGPGMGARKVRVTLERNNRWGSETRLRWPNCPGFGLSLSIQNEIIDANCKMGCTIAPSRRTERETYGRRLAINMQRLWTGFYLHRCRSGVLSGTRLLDPEAL